MRFHGGDFWVKGNVIDFSANLNPLGTPRHIEEEINHCIIKARIYTKYPDYDYNELRKAIAYFYNIDYRYLIATNGAAEALNLTIIALKPSTLIIVSPSYGDYDLLCKALSIKCLHLLMDEHEGYYALNYDELLKYIHENKYSVIIITNPNNPTGIVIEHNHLIDLALEAKRYGSWLMIDEVYSELSNYATILKTSLPENIVVVKSFTKTFNVPGLRLGFLYTPSHNLIEKVNNIRPTWNVNSIADYVFRRILINYKKDLWKFIETSKTYINQERSYLMEKLRGLGFQVYKSETNFILLKHPWIHTIKLRDMLLEKYRILIRPAHTFYGLTIYHSRIAVRKREENKLLVKALEETAK